MQLEGANCECDRRVWRMDVGMSEGVLNANPQAKRAACSEHACVLPVILLFVVRQNILDANVQASIPPALSTWVLPAQFLCTSRCVPLLVCRYLRLLRSRDNLLFALLTLVC